MIESFVDVFGKFGVFLVVAICSCLPGLETKIAVPLGASKIWGENSLSLFEATAISFVFSTICAICLMLVFKFLLKTLKKHKKPKFLLKILKKTQFFLQKPLNLFSQKKPKKVFWLLVFFVFAPLPILGLFSGAVLCAILGIKNKLAISALVLGNFFDSVFVLLLCLAFKPFLNLLLAVFVIIAILMTLFTILKIILQKVDEKKLKNPQKHT